MPTSRLGAVIDALVTTLDAGTAVAVYDGYPVLSSLPADFVVVGGAPDPDADAASLEQAWAGLGAKSRDETGEITCAVVAQSGGTVHKPSRDRVLVILGELETAIRSDPTLGGAVAAGWLHVTTGALSQQQNSNGSRAVVTFTVSYRTRI